MVARRRTKTKKPLEFSQMLASIVTTIFILTWAVAWVIWILRGELPQEMLDFINNPFMVIITGYFAKSGVENYAKIKKSEEDTGNVV